MISEVPTGILADKIGRKKSIILAFVFQLLGEVEFIFAYNYLLFAVSAILAGLGFSFYSGCYEALMYDSLKTDNREHEMQKVAGLNGGLKLLATLFGASIGGFLAADLSLHSFILVIVLTAISVSIALIVSFFLKETHIKSEAESLNSFEILKEGLKLIRKNALLKRIIILSILATPFINYLLNFYQPYLLEAEVPGVWLGISLAIASLIGFFASKYAYTLEKIFGVQFGLLIATLLPGVLYIAMALIVHNWFSVVLFILAFSSMNMQSPIFADYRNRHIKSNIRATTLSMISMLSGFYVAIMGLCWGKIADYYSLKPAFILMGSVIIFSVLLIRIKETHVSTSNKL